MSKPTLKELLLKWTEVEPKRCRKIRSRIEFQLSGYWHGVHTEPGPSNLASIEYAVREAIEAQGWQWEMGYVDSLGRSALVWYNGRAQFTFRGLKDGPTVALLNAYLLALETKSEGGAKS